MGQERKWIFLKRRQMANKSVGKYSASLIFTQMQIKTIMKLDMVSCASVISAFGRLKQAVQRSKPAWAT
jgi:hypothetical protein